MKLTNASGTIINYYPLKYNSNTVLKEGYGIDGVMKEFIAIKDMTQELNSKLDDGYVICGFNPPTD